MNWSGEGTDPPINVDISNRRIFGSSRWEHDTGLTDGV